MMDPLLLILFVPPMAGALLPRRFVCLYYGWFALLFGALWLDVHVRAAADDGDRLGVGGVIMTCWFWLAAIAIAIRLVDLALFRRGTGDPEETRELRPIGCSSPLGLLCALFFFHWLSNRLAGASPSLILHGALVALAMTGLFVVVAARCRSPVKNVLRVAAAAFCFGTIMLTFNSVRVGYDLANRAQKIAAGRTYCMLTYAGSNRPRPAGGVLDLSPLVMRANGRHAVDGNIWLLVREPTGWTAYQGSRPQQAIGSEGQAGAPNSQAYGCG